MGVSVSFLPACVNVRIKKNTDQTIVFQLTDNSSTQGTGGNPIDITSDDIKFTAKTGYAGACAIATKTIAAGSHTNPTNGEVRIPIAAADTDEASDHTETCWIYEIRRCIGGAGGDELVYIEGNLIVVPSVGIC